MYDIEELEKTFLKHHEKLQIENARFNEEFKKNYPDEPLPKVFNEDFSLPLALSIMCRHLSKLMDRVD